MMEMNRRSLLRLFALAPVAAIASKAVATVEPLQLVAIPEGVEHPSGAVPLAGIRDLRAYDIIMDEYVCRLDLMGINAKGEIMQLHVAYKARTGEPDERAREPALMVLLEHAKHEGIDLRKLKPLEALDPRMVEFCRA